MTTENEAEIAIAQLNSQRRLVESLPPSGDLSLLRDHVDKGFLAYAALFGLIIAAMGASFMYMNSRIDALNAAFTQRMDSAFAIGSLGCHNKERH